MRLHNYINSVLSHYFENRNTSPFVTLSISVFETELFPSQLIN